MMQTMESSVQSANGKSLETMTTNVWDQNIVQIVEQDLYIKNVVLIWVLDSIQM